MVLNTDRNYLLDISRGMAACLVVFYHFGQARSYPGWYEQLISYGWLGVPIFFVISGYSIGISLNNSTSIGLFVIKRIARIFPAYWVSLFIILILIIINKITTGNNSIVSLPKTTLDLFNTFFCLYQPFSKTTPINWVYWTLTYEIFFYLMFSLTLIFKHTYHKFLYLFISITSLFFPFFQNLNALFFFKLIGYFIIGIALNEIKKKNLITATLLILTSIISISHNRVYCTGAENKLSSIIALIAALGFALLILIFSPYFKHKTVSTKIGNLSYGIYLFHIPLGIYLINIMGSSFIYKNNFFYISDILFLIFIIGFSGLIFKYIEKPIMNFVKKY